MDFSIFVWVSFFPARVLWRMNGLAWKWGVGRITANTGIGAFLHRHRIKPSALCLHNEPPLYFKAVKDWASWSWGLSPMSTPRGNRLRARALLDPPASHSNRKEMAGSGMQNEVKNGPM